MYRLKDYFIHWLKGVVKYVIYRTQRIVHKKYIEFHHFPFLTTDVRLKDEDAEILDSMCKLLEVLNLHYRVTAGTALGLYRNGKFIAHDNDLDFDILEIHNEKYLIKEMKKRGYSIGRIVYYEGRIAQVVFYNKEKKIVDFANWIVEYGKICTYEERGYYRSQDLKYFANLNYITAYSYSFPVAGYTDEWMEMRYGNDWKIPKTYKGDWKDECGDLHRLD